MIVEEPGFCQGSTGRVAQEKRKRTPATFPVPGRNRVANKLVAGVAGECRDGHALSGAHGIAKKAVARSDPDARLSIRGDDRALKRLSKLAEDASFALRATGFDALFDDLRHVARVGFVETVACREDQSAPKGHFQIELRGVGGCDQKLRFAVGKFLSKKFLHSLAFGYLSKL